VVLRKRLGGEPGRNRSGLGERAGRSRPDWVLHGEPNATEASVGEPGRNRTFNPQIKSLLLCQLSYWPTEWEGDAYCGDVVRIDNIRF
jgi:hypothetical protein